MAIEVEINTGGSVQSLQELINETIRLKQELSNATDPAEIERLAKELGVAEDAAKDFNAEIKRIQTNNAFSKLASETGKASKEINKLDIGKTAGELNKFGALASNLDLGPLSGGVGLATSAMEAFNVSLLGSPIAMWSAGIGVAVVAVGALINEMGLLQPIIDDFKGFFDGISSSLGYSNTQAEKVYNSFKAFSGVEAKAREDSDKNLKNTIQSKKNILELARAQGKSEKEIAKAQKDYDDARQNRITELQKRYSKFNGTEEAAIQERRKSGDLNMRGADLILKKEKEILEIKKQIDFYEDRLRDPLVKGDFRVQFEKNLQGLRLQADGLQSDIKTIDALYAKSLQEIADFGTEAFVKLGEAAGLDPKILKELADYAAGLEDINTLNEEQKDLAQEIAIRNAQNLVKAGEAADGAQKKEKALLREKIKNQLEQDLAVAKSTGNLKKQKEAEEAIIKRDIEVKKEDNKDLADTLTKQRDELAEADAAQSDETKKLHKEEIESLDRTIKTLGEIYKQYDNEQEIRLKELQAKIDGANASELARWKKFQQDKLMSQTARLNQQLFEDLEYLEAQKNAGIIKEEEYFAYVEFLRSQNAVKTKQLQDQQIKEYQEALGLRQEFDSQYSDFANQNENRVFLFSKTRRKFYLQNAIRILDSLKAAEISALDSQMSKSKSTQEGLMEQMKTATGDQLAELSARYNAELQLYQDLLAKKGELDQEYSKKKKQIETDLSEEARKTEGVLTEGFASEFTKRAQIASEFNDALSIFSEARLNRELAAAGENEAAQEAARKRDFERQQKFALANAIISGAQAVVQASAVAPPGVGAALAIATGIKAAAQIALIKSQKYQGSGGGGGGSISVPNASSPGTQGAQPSFSFFGQQFGGNEVGGGNTPRQGAPEPQNITVDVKISESEITSTQQRIRRMNVGSEL